MPPVTTQIEACRISKLPFDRERHYPNADVEEIDFASRDEWLGFLAEAQKNIQNVADHTAMYGLYEPITLRHFPPDQIAWDRSNLRETGLTRGISSRVRSVLYALHSCVGDIDRYEIKIYGAEAITDLALLLRGYFPKYLGTEFTSDESIAASLYPIPFGDLTHLTLPSATFDVAITSEVLEHVPDVDQALREIARILKPGGWHIGTCPFANMSESAIIKARLVDSKPVHLMEPEYHGNPMSPEGSLVFEIAGWDILKRAQAAGFSYARWKWIRSRTFGIASNEIGGSFVLCLQR